MRKLTATAVSAVAIAAVVGATPALAETATVNLGTPGWTVFTRDTGSLWVGPEHGAPAGLGTHALVLDTSGPDDPTLSGDPKATFFSPPLGADLDSFAQAGISYWTYRALESTTGEPRQQPAINLEIDVNGAATGGFTTLVFEPVYNGTPEQASAEGIWQFWDAAGDGIWWSTRTIPGAADINSFVTLDSIRAANPDAVVLRIGANQGGGNTGLLGAVDGLSGGGTTYNFEPYSDAESRESCKDGGWKTSTDPTFKNQGDCIAYYVSNGKSHGDA